jgi:hypothetical protein
MGLVEVSNQLGSTAMASEPGTMVLGLSLDPLSGRSPLSRWEACFPHHDTALLLGQGVAPGACEEDTVGRVVERLYDTGTRKIGTAWAVRADQVLGCDTRDVHCATTSVTVYGEYLPPKEAEEQPRPLRIPDG